MKTKSPTLVIDLRYQVDHITPKKIQLFEEYRAAPANAKLFIILIRRIEIEMISDGNKLVEDKVIKTFNNCNYTQILLYFHIRIINIIIIICVKIFYFKYESFNFERFYEEI